MDWGSILVLLGLLLLTALFVARPLFDGGGARARAGGSRRSALQAELDQVLDALHELDQDHATAKLSDEDVQAERPALVARGAALLRAIDESGPQPSPARRPAADDADAEFEAAVRHLRARPPAGERFCGNCGRTAEPGDRFCVHCGGALEPAEATA